MSPPVSPDLGGGAHTSTFQLRTVRFQAQRHPRVGRGEDQIIGNIAAVNLEHQNVIAVRSHGRTQ